MKQTPEQIRGFFYQTYVIKNSLQANFIIEKEYSYSPSYENALIIHLYVEILGSQILMPLVAYSEAHNINYIIYKENSSYYTIVISTL